MSSNKIDWDQIPLSNYAVMLLNKRRWFETAHELISTAAILEPHVTRWWDSWLEFSRDESKAPLKHGYHGVYMVLIAYALENLCKGYIVDNLPRSVRENIRSKGVLPKELDSHDLVKLVERTGLVPDPQEEELLRRLERACIWYGRYPVPRFYRDLGPKQFKDGKEYNIGWIGGGDINRIKDLVCRVRNQIGDRDEVKEAS